MSPISHPASGAVGTLAQRPLPTADIIHTLYWATDGGDNGAGGLYQCNGAAWVPVFDVEDQSGTYLAAVTPEAHGAVGDGVTDDTAAIQACIASNAVVSFTPGKNYKMGQVAIANVSHLRLQGRGATLTLSGSGARFDLSGTTTDVVMDGFEVIGDGGTANGHGLVGSLSDPSLALSRIKILNNRIYNCPIAISVNADSSGVLSDVEIAGNTIDTVVGTSSGQGYGIHVACGSALPANVRIHDNCIIGAQRHSIYCARGYGFTIHNNEIKDHRQAVTDGSYRPAILLARGGDMVCSNNVLTNCYDSCIRVGGGDTAQPRNFLVIGNLIVNPQAAVIPLSCGDDTPAAGLEPNLVRFIDNTVYCNTTACTGGFLHNAGRRVSYLNNNVYITGSSALLSGFTFQGTGETAAGTTLADDIRIRGNKIEFSTSGGSRGYRFNTAAAQSAWGIDFIQNKITAASTFSSAVSIDDPNLYIEGPTDGINLTSGVLTLGGTVFAAPANPSSTVSTSLVMMGLAVKFKPGRSGRVRIVISGMTGTATAVATVSLSGRYGTGTAPANGDAVTGTAFPQATKTLRAVTSAIVTDFEVLGLITGLTPGTTYWIDLAISTNNASDAASVQSLAVVAEEINV